VARCGLVDMPGHSPRHTAKEFTWAALALRGTRTIEAVDHFDLLATIGALVEIQRH
jgi:hypothetical protein